MRYLFNLSSDEESDAEMEIENLDIDTVGDLASKSPLLGTTSKDVEVDKHLSGETSDEESYVEMEMENLDSQIDTVADLVTTSTSKDGDGSA